MSEEREEGMERLSEQEWNRLIQVIRRNTCILVLGPGVAVTPDCPPLKGDSGLTDGLVESIALQMGEEGVCQAEKLTHIAQLYCQHPQFSRLDLEMTVCDYYRPHYERTTPLHLALAQLPFTLCVTTTFDRFLFNAFRSIGKQPVCHYYHFRKSDRRSPLSQIEPSFLEKPDHPVIYNLYGSCDDETSLVLSENDLLEFLVNVVRGEPPLPDFIKARFSNRGVSFLFLGFGFRHWYMRILLHILQAHRHQNPSLAVEDTRFFSHPEKEQIVVFFQNEHRIHFRWEGWESFAVELQKRYAASLPQFSPELPPVLPSDAPKAFLCHSSTDKSFVDDLGKELQAQGVAVWLDKQDLRGGDDWEQLIPSVIKSQVDYVVVLQSEAMVNRVESYFHIEIKAALDRQRRFTVGARFLIPAQVQAGCFLSGLEHLECVDLTMPDGSCRLAQTILEDWNRHGRKRRNA